MKGTAKNRWVHGFVIATFVTLYFMVSIISTIHVIDFFKLSNPNWLAISLAIAFEIGAAASLAAIVILEKTSRFMVWSLFLILTAMQAMGNTYYAFTNLADFQGWIELFGLVDAELIQQKRILSIVSGAILPIVALGFIKSLVDYIRPEEPQKTQYIKDGYVEDYLGGETKKKARVVEEEESEKRMNIIGQNGNDGIHYDIEEEPPVEVDEIEPPVIEVNEIEQRLVEVDEIEPPIEVELYKDEVEEDSTESEKEQGVPGRKIQNQQPYDSLKKIGKDWIV
jgi:hypothetical protein